MRTVYVNGEYLPETEAKVSIFDRGFLMADGVYEVTSVLGGKLIDFDGHSARLDRSLTELDMRSPMGAGRAARDPPRTRARQRDRGRARLSSGHPRRARRPRLRLSRPRDDRADRGALHAEQARPCRQSGGQRRHPHHLDRGSALGPARHQDGAAALSVDGQDDGQEGRRRRCLDGRGRRGDRGHLEQRLYRQGRHDRDARSSRPTSCTGSPAPRCCALPARRR